MNYRNKGSAVRRLLALLLLTSLLTLTLASCDLLDYTSGGNGAVTTAVTTAATTTAQTPTVPSPSEVTFQQYLTPEIPTGAGTFAYTAAMAAPSVVSVLTEAYVNTGAGSGVVCYVDETAGCSYVITNNHVVEGYTAVSVVPYNSSEEITAEVVGTDWQTDLAVLRIATTALPAATFGNSTELVVGQQVVAIGNPLGRLGGTVTDGIIGALARRIAVEGVTMTLIQHSAPVSPGNSGGGLFNLYGQLIGIVNAKSIGSGVEGLGFAIPIDLALSRVSEIMTKGYVSGTPSLGLTYGIVIYNNEKYLAVTDYLYNDELLATNQDTLLYGDILVSFDGVPIEEVADERKVLSNVEIGDSVEAVFYRRKSRRYVKVNLIVHEYVPAGEEATPPDDDPGDIEFN